MTIKYSELDLGQIEAIVNKLGGMDGVRRFLADETVIKAAELLKFVVEVVVNGVEKFVAKDAFGSDNPAGIKFWLGDNFRKVFLGKVEENVGATTVAAYRLGKASLDPEIMAELGEGKRVIRLAHFYQLIQAQANGQEGPLLVNGWTNIAYIEDENGTVWAVRARWDADYRGWDVNARSVESPHRWDDGRQVLSQVA